MILFAGAALTFASYGAESATMGVWLWIAGVALMLNGVLKP